MKSVSILFLILAVACTAFANSAYMDEDNQSLLLLQRQQLDIYGSARKLIEQLVDNLRKAANEATEAIGTFTSGVQDEAKRVRVKISSDVEKLRARVAKTMEEVNNRLIDSGVAVVDCIATHQTDANVLFNETMSKTLSCVDERIGEVGEQINGLSELIKGAVEFSNKVLDDMRKCTENNGNILTTGSCLGSVAVQAEMRAVVFTGQIGIGIARINLSIATLPATLEICAASRLVETGLHTARIIMEIGSCSAASVYTTLIGSTQNTF